MPRRVNIPTVLQMEAAECGAASLGMVLAHFGRYVPLEKLRDDCGVSRDGSKASNVIKAARGYGLDAKGFKAEPSALQEDQPPLIVHWNFNHFLVVEGFGKGVVYLNDPACGRRTVTSEEFSDAFTGVVLKLTPGDSFERGGTPPSVWHGLKTRLQGNAATIVYLMLASLGLVIPGLVIPTLSRVFVDDVLLGGKQDWLRPLLLGLLIAAILRAGLTWAKERYLLRLQTKLAVAHSVRFFWHVLRLPVSFFMARFAGDIGTRVRLNDRVANLIAGRFAESGLDVLMVIFYGALLMAYDVPLTIVGLVIASLNLAVLRFFARKRIDDNMRLQQEEGKLAGVAMGGLQVVETLKATGGESDYFAKWAGHWAKLQNSAQDLGVSTIILGTTPAVLTALNNAAILTIGGLRVMDGAMTVGMLVAFQSLMASFLGPVNNLTSLGSSLQETQADLNRLDDVLNHRIDGNQVEEGIEGLGGKLDGAVRLDNITFGYTKLAAPLIEDFNLHLRPGARIALVGGSGSGKSTIAKLVAGLYRPWEGEISLDGRPREEISTGTLQDSVSMVDQDIFMFEGTIRENITLWDPSITEPDIIRAAQDAGIHDEIASRPRGYDGVVEEGGRNFSGGQRQRIEIARALARNPTVLLLDEATSALDPRTEKRIDDNLRRRGCTCLIVAHRLSTIRDADEIIVLDRGQVVERGPHHDLMEAGGHYAELMGAA